MSDSTIKVGAIEKNVDRKESKVKKRDEKLDFYRGLVMLEVVLAHTCYFSGQSYVPEIMRTICLLYEMPLLVFLAGRSAQHRSGLSSVFAGLLNIWLKWVLISTLVVFGYRIICGRSAVTPTQYLQGLMFYSLEVNDLAVFFQSMWYMRMYVVVVLVAGVLQELDKRVQFSGRSKWSFVLFLVLGLAYASFSEVDSFFGLSRMQLCFLSFFMIGYLTKPTAHLTLKAYLLGMAFFATLWIGISRMMGLNFLNIQGVKFPPHFIYWAEAMLSIWTCFFLWQYGSKWIHRCGFIRFLGRHSLCFFFSQGLGAGFIYRFVPLNEQYGWVKVFLLSLGVNYLIMFFGGLAIFGIFRIFDRVANKIQLSERLGRVLQFEEGLPGGES